MREIKFRAWDKENKEMLDIEDLHWDDCTRDFSVRTTMYSDYFDTEDMILMQFTGLHDKNGKEIYEGDIIKAYDGRIQGEVVFDVRGLHFGIKMSDTENYTFSQNFLTSNNIEVIGNIYENRDLLKGDDNIE